MTLEEQKNVEGWNEWSKYVLKELERLNSCYRDLDEKISKMSERAVERNTAMDLRITTLYIKVAGVAGGAAVLTSLLFLLLTNVLKGK